MAIPIYERQIGPAPLQGARLRNSAGPDAYGAGIGRAVEDFGAHLRAKAYEFEDASTLEALNKFQREVEEHLNDPQKGVYNTRLGSKAFGVADDVDSYIDNLAWTYASKLSSPRARNNFNTRAAEFRDRQYLSNMKWESAKIDEYKNAEADASIATDMDVIANHYGDDEIVDAARGRIYQAGELKTRNLGPDARTRWFAEIDNRIHAARFGAMIEQDLPMAREWFETNKDGFNPEARAKAEAMLDNYENYAIADSLFEKYGTSIEGIKAARGEIRESGYKPDRQQDIMNSFNSRVNEVLVLENRAEQERNKAQSAFSDWIYEEYYAQGNQPPQDMLDGWLRDEKISAQNHRTMSNWNKVAVTRAEAEKSLRESDPEWNSYTPLRQEEMTMRRMGVTQEDREEALARIKERITDPDYPVTKADIDAEYLNGRITKGEREHFKSIISGYNAETKKIASLQSKRMTEDLNEIFSATLFADRTERKRYADVAEEVFRDRLYYLDPRSKTYGEDVKQARIEAIAAAIMEKAANADSLVIDEETYENTVTRVVGEAMSEEVVNYAPQFRIDPISLSEGGAGGFDESVRHVLNTEGGYVNDPDDSGGETNRGVTKGTFDAARAAGIISEADIKNLTVEDARKIYKEMYWNPVRADELPEGVRFQLFDMAINHGVSGAVSPLQGVLGLKRTGKMDDETVRETNEIKPGALIEMLTRRRRKLYKSIVEKKPEKEKYSKGWNRRNEAVAKTASDMAETQPALAARVLREEEE
jgi:lysozyme family protein